MGSVTRELAKQAMEHEMANSDWGKRRPMRHMGDGEAWVDQAKADGTAPAPPDWIHAGAFPRLKETMNSSAKAPAPSVPQATASPPTRMDTVIAMSVDIGRNHQAVAAHLAMVGKLVQLARDAMESNGGRPLIGMTEVLTFYVPRIQETLTRLLASEPSPPPR